MKSIVQDMRTAVYGCRFEHAKHISLCISPGFSSNSEANASELLENPEEMCPLYLW